MAATGRTIISARAGAVGLALAGIALAASAQPPAGWEHEFGTLRIGMISPSGGRAVAGLREITTAFERATGVAVEILAARDFPALIRAQAQGRIHYAVQSAMAFAATDALCGCVEPVAAARGIDGAVGLRAVLIVRSGKADTLEEISRLRVVAGPADDVGPQAAALAEIRERGNAASVVHAASHSDAERIFRERGADVLVGWEPVYDGEPAERRAGTLARLAADGVASDDIAVAWSSETIAYGPHSVRSDVPDELKQRLGRLLVNLRDQQPDVYQMLEPNRGGGFFRIDPENYAPARRLAARFGSR